MFLHLAQFGFKQNDQTVEKERERRTGGAVVERTKSPRLTAKERAILLPSPAKRLSAERARSNYTGGKKRKEEMESDCLGDP